MKHVILVQENWDGCQQGDGLVMHLKKKQQVPVKLTLWRQTSSLRVPQVNANANIKRRHNKTFLAFLMTLSPFHFLSWMLCCDLSGLNYHNLVLLMDG